MSAEAYQKILEEKRRYTIHRAAELNNLFPAPLSLGKMIGEVIKTRREMNRIKRSRFL